MFPRSRLIAPPMGGGAATPYWQKVLNVQPANLIGFWRLNETSGAVAADSSPEGNDGAYTGVDLANAAGPDGVLVPFWDGLNDYCNIYSAAFNADFDGQEGTLAAWAKVNAAAVWEDGANRRAVALRVNASNLIRIGRTAANNRLEFLYYAGGTTETILVDGLSYTGWFHVAMTWSLSAGADGEFKAFINGAQVGTTQTALGTWAGDLDSTRACIGADSTVPAQVWHGWIAPTGVWNTPLTPAEIAAIATV